MKDRGDQIGSLDSGSRTDSRRRLRHQRAKRLYERAELLEPDARRDFLEASCRDDPDLHDEVASLLAHENSGEAFFDRLTQVVLSSATPFLANAVLRGIDRRRRQAAHPAPDLPAGHPVGHYRILGRVGSGGMGTVYRAHDTRLDRNVALKFLPPQLSVRGEHRERLFIEAKAAAALEHPNVCTVYEVGETDDSRPFIAMALYEGETLEDRLRREPLTVEESVQVALQIARGLGAAHARGIVHRDVKPGNVMLATDGTVKLLDFGLAQPADASLARTGMTPGTLAYMSPEQIRGEPLDPRTDLWSLGVVFHEMLAGERPFRGASDHALLRAILHDDPEPVWKKSSNVHESLQGIVQRLLDKDRDKRYGNAEELMADLERMQLGSRPGPSRRSSHGNFRRRHLAFSGFTVVLLVAILGGVRWIERTGNPATGTVTVPARVERVLVVDFANFTSDSLLGDAVSQALRMDLARSPDIRVVRAPTVAGALRRMHRAADTRLDSALAREVAMREGILAVIDGEVRPAGAGYVVSAALVETASGEVVNGWRETAQDRTEVIGAIDRLSTSIRMNMGESLASLEAGEPLFHAVTGSLDALRIYSVAGRAYHRGDFFQAAVLFEEAIRLDPAFARAHILLAYSLTNAGVGRGRVLRAFANAYRHRDGLPAQEHHAAVAEYYRSVVGDLPKAIDALYKQVEAARGTGELTLYQELGWSLSLVGDLGSAEAVLQDARQVFPTAGNQGALVRVLFRRGKPRQAAAALENVMKLYPNHPRLSALRVAMAAASGDFARADSLARDLPSGGRVGVSHRLLALSAAVRGRTQEALGHLRAQQREQISASLLAEAAEVAVAIGRLRIAGGDRQGALAEVEGFLARHPLGTMDALDVPYLSLARFFAEAGRAGRARQMLAAYETRVPPEFRGPDRWHHLRALAAIRLADRDARAAIVELERANRELPSSHGSFEDPFVPLDQRPELARAYDLAGQTDAAITIYERYLAARSVDRTVLDAFELPGAIFRLAELYETRGEPEAAARHYQRFAELWSHADPGLQPRVEAARKRAAELRSIRPGI